MRKVLEPCKSVLITSHNNPDPDAVVSAVLLKRVIQRATSCRVTLGYSGMIGRAENSALVKYADASLRPMDDLDMSRFDAVALVDAQPGTGNHAITMNEPLKIVIDHHRLRRETRRVPFYDVQTDIGATTTLGYIYWKALKIKPTRKFATMMFYALRTETADMGREASAIDREVYNELYALADLRALSLIVNAKVGKEYFSAVYRAIENSKVYGSLIVTRLGRLAYPDLVAQIADYFARYRDVKYVCAIGVHKKQMLLSLRSDDPTAHLGKIARTIVHGMGTAGGHGSAAGGQIDIGDGSSADKISQVIVKRLTKAVGQSGVRPRRLIPSPTL